jgi:hypothetical protein
MGQEVSREPDIPPEQLLNMMVQSIMLLGSAYWELFARFEALTQTVCELHPEIEKTVKERVQAAQNESAKGFASLQ